MHLKKNLVVLAVFVYSGIIEAKGKFVIHSCVFMTNKLIHLIFIVNLCKTNLNDSVSKDLIFFQSIKYFIIICLFNQSLYKINQKKC